MTNKQTLEYLTTKFGLKSLDKYGYPYNKEKQKVIREVRLNDFTRDDLAGLFAELDYREGAEIGVERGLYSIKLCQANPDLKLHCVDPLTPYKGYREHVSKREMDKFYNELHDRLEGYDCMYHRMFSMDAVKNFPARHLDFVYIDGNHDFQNTTNDIVEWSKIVKVGGIIAGHDYNRNKKKDYMCHVKDVVQGYTYAMNIYPYFITSDKSPSWFWVNR